MRVKTLEDSSAAIAHARFACIIFERGAVTSEQ